MASNSIYNNMCLVGAMDRLWFHQIILLSQPNHISLTTPQSLEEESLLFNESQSPSLSFTSSSLGDEDIITETDSSSPTSDESNSLRITPYKKEIRAKRKSYSFNNSKSNRSHSSQSPRDRRSRSLSTSATHLQKTTSCRSLGELELEEVKGFLDLGFTFKKEHLSPRMISLIPGLQRFDSMSKDKGHKSSEHGEEDDEEEEEVEEEEVEEDEGNNEGSGVIIRPYLSEAWLIKRPSSPLLNLKVPRASEASDMKKHLKFWARVVASEIQQES